MILFKYKADLADYLQKIKNKGSLIGFVPTMGALHEGHISLIEECKKQSDVTVSSIFINPTQFNNKDDFNKYPVTIESDIAMLEKSNCDILFMPSVDEIYTTGEVPKKYDLGYLENILEGAFRPGHFQGVCQVVDKLLTIVDPDILFLGQKDYQQCLVIKKLAQITNKKMEIRICETRREKDGLAMSSRNLRLSVDQRKVAPEIYKTLLYIRDNISKVNDEIIEKAKEMLISKGFNPDYVEIKNMDLEDPINNEPFIILIAAYLGEIRLIDNLKAN